MVQWDHDSSHWDVFLIEAEDGPCEDTMADLVTSAAYLWMTHAIELAPRITCHPSDSTPLPTALAVCLVIQKGCGVFNQVARALRQQTQVGA